LGDITGGDGSVSFVVVLLSRGTHGLKVSS
jgi:hypothetical protein